MLHDHTLGTDAVVRTGHTGPHRLARIALGCATLLLADAAVAVDFPVSGSLTINGNLAVLPDGGVFAGSSYDAETGAIGEGAFVFPEATLSFDTPLGTAVATYVLSQTNTSSGEVWSDSTAALTPSDLVITVTHLTISGLPIDLGTCVVGPTTLELAGTASVTGLALAYDGFVIPPVDANDCADYGDQINDALAGTNNQGEFDIAGDFTPDTVFADGFDP